MTGVEKLVNNGIQVASQAIQKSGKVFKAAANPIEAGSEKLASTLDGLATSNYILVKNMPSIQKVHHGPEYLPDYLYHMTRRSNYESILKDGGISGCSITEGLADKSIMGMQGTYMVSRDNFLHNWLGYKEKELFGDTDVGEALLVQVGAITTTPTDLRIIQNPTNSMVAIEIPTSLLDLSKLRFRPYIEASKAAIESYITGVPNKLVTNGLPISELQNYVDKIPIEFVYQGKITPDMFSTVTQSQADLPFLEIVNNLFGRAK